MVVDGDHFAFWLYIKRLVYNLEMGPYPNLVCTVLFRGKGNVFSQKLITCVICDLIALHMKRHQPQPVKLPAQCDIDIIPYLGYSKPQIIVDFSSQN